MTNNTQIVIGVTRLDATWCKLVFQLINNDSQFSILERADEDVVPLHSHVFVAVRGDDLVAEKQETVRMRWHCVCVTVQRRRGEECQNMRLHGFSERPK